MDTGEWTKGLSSHNPYPKSRVKAQLAAAGTSMLGILMSMSSASLRATSSEGITLGSSTAVARALSRPMSEGPAQGEGRPMKARGGS